MKVFFHERFHDVYTSDPAAAPGRIAAVVTARQGRVDFVAAEPAEAGDILAVHEPAHVEDVKHQRLYDIAALAAGGAVQAAELGLIEHMWRPSRNALVRRRGMSSACRRALTIMWPIGVGSLLRRTIARWDDSCAGQPSRARVVALASSNHQVLGGNVLAFIEGMDEG
jgi:hypothetical protein